MLGEDFLRVPRLSRIYYQGVFFSYPLDFFNVLSNLGILESTLTLFSYLKARLCPSSEEQTFEQWVTNRFGRRLYKRFFQSYTEKVWGIACDMIEAEWAAQRIRGLSLRAAVVNALFDTKTARTLIREFRYPVLGAGMMWQRFQQAVESQGGQVWLEAEVVRLEREGGHVTGVVVKRGGQLHRIMSDHVISSMPVPELIARLDPLASAETMQAACRLSYRALILVGLIVDRADLFPDNWIYVHSPEVKVGRIQNFKNWSLVMVPDPRKSGLGMEYFCAEGDATWRMSDAELIELAVRDLVTLGLARPTEVKDAVVIRQPRAYPLYDRGYREHLRVIQAFLAKMDNLQTIGRSGIHRYDNQDHSMLTGMLAVRNLLGEHHDLWNVNTERSYYEET